MNTIEMLNKVHVGQKAYSESLNITVSQCDMQGIIDEKTKASLRLNSLVLDTDDWKLVPQQITDYNELFKLFDTDEGVTLTVEDFGRRAWRHFNKNSVVNQLKTKDLTNGKWFKGKLTTKELREWGLV